MGSSCNGSVEGLLVQIRMVKASARKGASKASRHSKKYGRKGANVGDIEENFFARDDEAERAAMAEDGGLFVVDREGGEEKGKKLKVTRRQQAALDRISARPTDALPTFPKKPPKKLIRPNNVKKPASDKPFSLLPQPSIDLWNTDLNVKVGIKDAEAAEHFKRQRRIGRVKVPVTVKQKPSVLRAVPLPHSGASYNPALDDYKEYTDALVEKEKVVIKNDEKLKKGIELPEGERYATEEERRQEEMEGLEDEGEEGRHAMEEECGVDAEIGISKDETKSKKETERKTKKERRKAVEKKKKEREAERALKTVAAGNDVFKAKALNRKLRAVEVEQTARAATRAATRRVKAATTRARLGRGKLEEAEEELLLPEQLPSSLRGLNPQGNLIVDRLQSLQKRNMIEIAGKRNAHKLKERLKSKLLPTRAMREVGLGTKVL